MEGLNARYVAGQLGNSLAAEGESILKVKDTLQQRIPQQPPIRRYSLSKDSRRLLGPTIQEVKEQVASP